MPTQGEIKFEELGWEPGCSVTEKSLVLYTEEEKEFFRDFNRYCREELLPKANKFYAENPTYEEALRIWREIPRKYTMKNAPADLGGGGCEKKPMFHNIFEEEINAISYSIENVGRVSVFCLDIESFMTKEQREKWLRPMVEFKAKGADCITEPTSGSDVYGGMKTRAVRDGDYYIINGEKCFITSCSKADIMAIYCITNPDVHPHDGMSIIMMSADTPGFSLVKDYQLMGRIGTVLSHVKFENCRVPKENLVGKENGGAEIFDWRMDWVRTDCCFRSIGLARSCFEIAAKFAQERLRFGRRLSQFEGISFKLVDMYTSIETARLLGVRVARMLEKYGRAPKEAANAKFYAADMAPWVCGQALWILGGIGYTTLYPVERIYRDAAVEPISEGASLAMKYLVQREIYKDLK